MQDKGKVRKAQDPAYLRALAISAAGMGEEKSTKSVKEGQLGGQIGARLRPWAMQGQ